jgi:hypothetical protein
MRPSTRMKHFYQSQGITVFRAIQDDGMIRLTVPINTGCLAGQVLRQRANQMIGGPSKTKDWIWISDPCGGRNCDECEIGGCDHGIEVR